MTRIVNSGTGDVGLIKSSQRRATTLKELTAGSGITLTADTNQITIATDTTDIGGVVGGRCTAQFDATSGTTGTTLTNVTGMSVSLVAGATYIVEAYVRGVSTANSGMKLALGGTATWTSVDAGGILFTASAVTAAGHATATPGTSIVGSTAANIQGTIKATIVVNAAGTLTLMAAQNASHADTTSVYVNSNIKATRIA